MSIATETLRYGWKIIAGVVLIGSTIYVTDSTQQRITQRDAIQVILGTVERCLATQTSTNPTYSVNPPNFVRSWVSTNGLTGTNFAWVTNQVTNTISWYTDRAMMVTLDESKQILPYWYTTNPPGVYVEWPARMTATGIFDQVQIGNYGPHITVTTNISTNPPPGYTNIISTTNCGSSFTQIPAWTNNVGLTNCTTNAATFGPWAWRNYKVAWQERYKFLWALSNVVMDVIPGMIFTNGAEDRTYSSSGQSWYLSVTWYNFSEISADPSHADIAGCKPLKTAAELRGIGAGYWGQNNLAGGPPYYIIVDDGEYTYGDDDVTYYSEYYIQATTNADIGAKKGYSFSSSGPSVVSWDMGWFTEYSAWQEQNVYLKAGTDFKDFQYNGLTPFAQSKKLFRGDIIAVISGVGSPIPLVITDDEGTAGSWADVTTADSPLDAYSESFKSKLTIRAGDLDYPTIQGDKSCGLLVDVNPCNYLVSDSSPFDGTNFFYCTNKYW